jgi:epoxyqueuosine reductase
VDASIITKLEDRIKAEGFAHFGFSPLASPLSLPVYQKWLEDDLQGEMSYLKQHLPFKENPEALWPQARSAIVIGLNYLPHPEAESLPLKHLKVARYARGKDYHHFFKARLAGLADRLRQDFPQDFFDVHTDSSPLMERDLGYQARLGWFGKNSCLIHPKKGSLFLLGEILTSLPLLSSEAPVADFCGTCTRCLDQCPTAALRPDRTLDSEKCISYLNIELKGLPPFEMIPSMRDWFFGCDICQEVCPWNKKVFGPALTDPPSSRADQLEELRYLLTSSNKKLERDFHSTPLLRRRGFGLKRNALIVAFHLRAVELREVISPLCNEPKLAPLALWVLDRLNHDS